MQLYEWVIFVFLILLNTPLTLLMSKNPIAEFWKQVPPNEPYRVILGDVRDKLYSTRERSRQLLANGISDIPEDTTFNNVEQVLILFKTFNLHPSYQFTMRYFLANLV